MTILVTFRDRTTQNIENAEVFTYSEVLHGYTIKVGDGTVVLPAKGVLYITIVPVDAQEKTKEEAEEK